MGRGPHGVTHSADLVPVMTTNALLIGLIIVAVVGFVVIYAQKMTMKSDKKLAPRYDSDL